MREVARGTTTFACSGAAVLSAHMEYSVTTLLPALIACAVQLRDYERTALVIRWFTFIVVAIAVVHAGSRYTERMRPAPRGLEPRLAPITVSC